jgi:CDP-diacylglycerol--serine O-phosphatidyltransferase
MHDGHDSDTSDDWPRKGVVVRKRRKGIYILPNLFTLAALFGGFYAVVMAMNGRFDLAPPASSAPWCWTAWTAASRA